MSKRLPAVYSFNLRVMFVTILSICIVAGYSDKAVASPAGEADQILKATGVKGGLVVHLGCGDGKLTAALYANDGYLVHGLDSDDENIAKAREYIQKLGIYGKVSVEPFNGKNLPYVDNLVNLLIVEDLGRTSIKEVMRVLVPNGVAYIKKDGTWSKAVKPRPKDIDEWGHFLHDASNNAVANDSVVGPPRNLQWLASPLWLRSHETPSGIQSQVSAGGRLFYFFDEGLIGITDERLPDRWSLVCRDAFNGKLLWKRPVTPWGWREWSRDRYEGKDWTTLRRARTDVPIENQRMIVAQGDRVYATLGYGGSMSILDAATGAIITTVTETQGTREILVTEGMAVVYTRQVSKDAGLQKGYANKAEASLVAVEARTGKFLWHKKIGQIRSLSWAINNGRIVYLDEKNLVALDLKSNRELWAVPIKRTRQRTLLTVDDVIVMQDGANVAAYDARDGSPLWHKPGGRIGGWEADDLFVIDGLVWRGITSVNDESKRVGKSPNALMIGWDLRTGDEKNRILVKNLRSPEHHHRCYRNKATVRYLISSYEGAEFLDFKGDNHGQHNWLRGSCVHGMMPCNGMLYVPPDQCFCQPGAKLLGYAAVTAETGKIARKPDKKRLKKGPAYGKAFEPESPSIGNWPTFRHDAARSGTTQIAVPPKVDEAWKVELGGKLTAPVAWCNKVFVAKPDAHTVFALDMADGAELWRFTVDGRVDSPPTIYQGMVLFGSSDGHVYCLRASDGELVWRFLAAPADRRVACFDQVESVWPVHGSVLVEKGVAYCTAGRSTYLDGGIRVWGLDPVTGKILHKGLLEGPHRDVKRDRDLAFFILGANSDVLVAEGGFVYMRQKKMTPELKEVDVPVLSSKGAQDVGLHVFSTAGLLDDSWYNRTFWMYSKRWPGFQLANQAPKAGQLLVVDDEKTYAVRVFYRRNVHSPMFNPGKEGYLLFADANTNEPQIVGEEGSRQPVKWLPQSDYSIGRGNKMTTRKLESEAFGLDKMIGYTRAEPPVWMQWLPVRIRAMVKAGDTLFVAGAPDVFDAEDPYAAFEGRKGAKLVAVSAKDGNVLRETPLESPPVFDGMIAAGGRLFASLRDGSVVCLAGK